MDFKKGGAVGEEAHDGGVDYFELKRGGVDLRTCFAPLDEGNDTRGVEVESHEDVFRRAGCLEDNRNDVFYF
jgi:hypothetical protein